MRLSKACGVLISISLLLQKFPKCLRQHIYLHTPSGHFPHKGHAVLRDIAPGRSYAENLNGSCFAENLMTKT